jgi:glycerol uptake facilitator protein
LAELVGTFVLVFFGLGAVHASILTGAQSGLWQVAVVWAVAVALAIYSTSAVSGAHINPAITLAMVVHRRFPLRKAPLYMLSQIIGAFLAAALLYALFAGAIHHFETTQGIVRGEPGSERSAMLYGAYFPNPAVQSGLGWSPSVVCMGRAMLAEGVGTALLAFFVFGLSDPRNRSRPGRGLFPLLIGLVVAIIVSVIAPLTQAGLNPARDFGPRFFAWLMGWGSVAIPGPRGGFFTVYILAPILGALLGALAYRVAVRPGLGADHFHEKKAEKPENIANEWYMTSRANSNEKRNNQA